VPFKADTVATLLDPVERSRFDAATGEYCFTLHARNVGEAYKVVREKAVNAVLLSPSCISRREVSRVARLAREFPRLNMVAVLSHHDQKNSERLLELGMSGVRSVVDLSGKDGWTRLRDVVGNRHSRTNARILEVVRYALGDATEETHRLFQAMVMFSPKSGSAKDLSDYFDVAPSTFMSRFFRAGIPSPKCYLAQLRLLQAAALLEEDGLSIGDIAYRLEYSSPQSFGRHVKMMLGMTASEFRSSIKFEQALREFTEVMIIPFQSVFRTFQPF